MSIPPVYMPARPVLRAVRSQLASTHITTEVLYGAEELRWFLDICKIQKSL